MFYQYVCYRDDFTKTYVKMLSLILRIKYSSTGNEFEKESWNGQGVINDLKKNRDILDAKVIDEEYKETVYKIFIQKILLAVSEVSSFEDLASQQESDTVYSTIGTSSKDNTRSDLFNGNICKFYFIDSTNYAFVFEIGSINSKISLYPKFEVWGVKSQLELNTLLQHSLPRIKCKNH